MSSVKCLAPDTLYISSFESWEKAFMYLGKQSMDERLIVVLDEFPYIVNSNKSIPSLLQNLIDHYLKDKKLFLIICGSSMSFIEKEVLSYKSPLMIDHVYSEKIQPELNNYLGAVFEDICTEYLKCKNKKMELPFVFDKIGRWWGNNLIRKREEEIDILAINKQNALFGECKWTNAPVDMGIVNSLVEKSSILNYSQKYYIFFSKGGYTKEVRRLAEAGSNMFLVELKDFGGDWV